MVIKRELNIQLSWEEESANESFIYKRLCPLKQIQVLTYSERDQRAHLLPGLPQVQTQTL